MDGAQVRDRNGLRDLWPYAGYSALTAAFAFLLVPVNAGVYQALGNSDPQGDEQLFAEWYTAAVMRHTSGFAFGLLFALFLGVTLAVRRRSTFAGTVVRSVLGGALLAVVNVGVAWFAGGPRHVSRTPSPNGTLTDGFEVDLLHDDGFRQAILGGAAGFPIWAVAGVGIGVLLRNATNTYARDMAALLAAGVALLSMGVGFLLGAGEGAGGTFVAILLWPPSGATGFITKVALHDHPTAAMAAFLGGSLCYAVAWSVLGRRRFDRRPPS
jgi:hypothetical protein